MDVTVERVGVNGRLRVLAVANWDFAWTEVPWATMRIEALRRAGADVDVLDEDCVHNRLGFLRLWRRLQDQLASGQYDVVAPLYGSVLGLVCAAQRRVPCALSLAGSDVNGTPAADGRTPWSQLASIAASNFAAALADGTSVRTRAMRDALWWPSLRGSAEVIPSGVDVLRFRPGDRDDARRLRGLPLDRKRVVFVAIGATVRIVKRVELAREAVALLDDVALDVIEGVPYHEMPLVYVAADVLVLTSHREGSPNCIKEALACGVPVVSVDVGDVREVIEGLTNCAVVPDDPRAIADALARAIADGCGCPEGPAVMAERYSIDAMARRFVAFYERVAGLGG